MINKKNFLLYCLSFLSMLLSAQIGYAQTNLDLQGHRGCRGLMPENTIPAMIKAIDLGVTTLEMDVVISKDNQVVVSHDSYFNSLFCLTPEGNEIPKEKEKEYNLFKMDYREIRQYDVGTKTYPAFSHQQKMKTYRPLLGELIDSVEEYTHAHKLEALQYNIEIKSSESTDGIFHPKPEEFVKLVMDVLKDKGICDRVTIQSFDERPLQLLHATYPEMQISWLVANLSSVNSNFKKLGFSPDIYSPYYKMVRKRSVKKCHKQNVKIIPWTVNDQKKMKKLIKIGVDGLITDYPDINL